MNNPDSLMTKGQRLALEQLHEVERFGENDFEVVSTISPEQEGFPLHVLVSVRTEHLPRAANGLPLRGREQFWLTIPDTFPFQHPTTHTRHTRFSGWPHVQWKRTLCLYLAVDVEWNPSDGMFGFIDRLWLWIKKGAVNELDPFGGPLHPPVAYPKGEKLVVPRENTPSFDSQFWAGLARLKIHHENRADIIGWSELFGEKIDDPVGAVILLSDKMPFEFPKKVIHLFKELEARGVSREMIFLTLQSAVISGDDEKGLFIVVGTPMRGIRGSDNLKQHLTAWYIQPIIAKAFRLSIKAYSEDLKLRKIGEDVERIIMDWAKQTEVEWCNVREDRPEIITRRDFRSPSSIFKDRAVAIWGCGALGGHIAIYLARTGVKKLVLRDNSVVTPGIIVRQPFEDVDIGKNKVEALKEKIENISPDIEVEALSSNIITSVLSNGIWIDNSEIVIDCSASRIVRSKLEEIRRSASSEAVPIVSMMVDHKAERGLVVLASQNHSGGVADVLRNAKLKICNTSNTLEFANSFYPEIAEEQIFQPEPGCSSPTFIGSASDVASLAGSMLNLVAIDLQSSLQWGSGSSEYNTGSTSPKTASAHFISQPHVLTSSGVPNTQYYWNKDHVYIDSSEGYQIRIAPKAWDEIFRLIDKSREQVGPEIETGGLLFGERDDALGIIWISDVIGPPRDSLARSDIFVCGIEGTLAEHRRRITQSRGSIQYIGMWHTHPVSDPVPSATDLSGMKIMLDQEELSPSRSLLMIIGTPHSSPKIGCYVFDRSKIRSFNGGLKTVLIQPATLKNNQPSSRNIGLALSGGGSRAIAFHLGCLRTLHRRGILDQVDVISAVSGGSVIAAMYAYSKGSFEEFESSVINLLRRGLQVDIAKRLFLSRRFFQSIATNLVSGTVAFITTLIRAAISISNSLSKSEKRSFADVSKNKIRPPLRRWISRTTAFEDVLNDRLYKDSFISDSTRKGVSVVLNATDLRTSTAFRFGNLHSSSWRYGSVVDNDVRVATAVAASAAYPALLPALHKKLSFEKKDGTEETCNLVLTDGGVYDNLGVTCLEPGRHPDYSAHRYNCDYIICCNAGHGQLSGNDLPYGWRERMTASVKAIMRKGQDGTQKRLFEHRENGKLKGLILPYLGMQDHALARDLGNLELPDDFISRDEVIGYPTDFRAMSDADLARLSKRGEQLTKILLDAYWSE